MTLNLQQLSATQHQETVVGDFLPLHKERRHGTSATFRTYFSCNMSITQNIRNSMPNAVLKPFLLVRFLCGFPKKMNPGVEPGLDGLSYLIKVVGTLPDRRLAFFTGLKKVSKERTTLAAGISVACCQ